MQDLYQLSNLSRTPNGSSSSLQDAQLTLKQKKIRQTSSIQEAIHKANSQSDLRIFSGPGMDYYTQYRNAGMVFKDGRAYRTYEYQFLSKKQKISLGRRQPVSIPH